MSQSISNLFAIKSAQKLGFLIVIFWSWAFQFQAQELSVNVVSVHDGDTITVLAAGNEQIKVRLEGIDAPELKQPLGEQCGCRIAGSY